MICIHRMILILKNKLLKVKKFLLMIYLYLCYLFSELEILLYNIFNLNNMKNYKNAAYLC